VEEAHGNVRRREYHGLVYSVTDDKGNKVGNPLESSLPMREPFSTQPVRWSMNVAP